MHFLRQEVALMRVELGGTPMSVAFLTSTDSLPVDQNSSSSTVRESFMALRFRDGAPMTR